MDKQIMDESLDNFNDSSFESIDPIYNQSELIDNQDSKARDEPNLIERTSENINDEAFFNKNKENKFKNTEKSEITDELNKLNESYSSIFDVIIIGAGISGLYSAYYLMKKNKNLKILVIEGKNRVGGRTQTVEIISTENGQKSKWDLGGQWVTDTQKKVTSLLKELNIETYQQYLTGKKILETNGKIVSYNASIPNVSLLSLLDLQLTSMKISTNAKKISTINPFENLELASRLDSENLNEFMLSKSFSSSSRSLLDPAIRTIYGVEATQINSLFGLMYIKSGGGTFESLALADKGCAQEKRIKGGTQQISEKLFQLITENENNKILLDTALAEIRQTESCVEIYVKKINQQIEKFECKKVVSSIPINQYIHIKFEPELPSYKRNVFQYCQMGNLIKFIVTYKTPFWRNKGFSGEVISDGSVRWLNHSNISDHDLNYSIPNNSPVACVFDGTNDKGEAALVGFIGAKMAVEWMDVKDELRRQEVIEALVRYFGKESRDYLEYVEKVWAREKFSGGCPTCNLSSSGVMQDFVRAVREPFLNLHFCGTESATEWQGYIDGAIESGERAANEVLYSLFKDDRSIDYDYENTFFYQKEFSKSKVKK